MVKVQGLPIKKKERERTNCLSSKRKKSGIRKKKNLANPRKKGQKGREQVVTIESKQKDGRIYLIRIYKYGLYSTIKIQKLTDKIKCKFLSYDIIKKHI